MKIKAFLSSLAIAALAFTSCSTPQNIQYFQDMSDNASIKLPDVNAITLQPMDQISIIVNSRDPELSALFNLPYYTRRIGETQSLTASNAVSSTSSQNISGYTVDSNDNIDFPVLGSIHVAGMKREQVAAYIKEKIIESRQVKDPVVTVEYMNLGVSVLGEVARPGRYKIDRDQFTIFDAIGIAGDLTINGNRQNVTIIRHNGDSDDYYHIDLTRGYQVYSSPAYYIKQGDVVYVTPNDKRQRESTVNGNNLRSSSFWISLASLLTSVAVFIFK